MILVTTLSWLALSTEIKNSISLFFQKKDKDPVECASYHPLSVLNCYLKLFTSLIHPDQTDFVKNHLALNNIHRLLHIIEAASDNHPWAVLTLDADKVEWSYLWAVLRPFSFGSFLIKMVCTLYSSPTTCVQTGHPGSSDFVLSRGTRQGCPLSLALSTLSLEPLVQAVRESHDISPIIIKGTLHHISLYADDILLYLSNVNSSVSHVLNLFCKFSSSSGYKINWPKLILMPLFKSSTIYYLSHVPVSLQPQGFTYLSIHIRPTISQLIQRNFSLVEKDFSNWSVLNAGLNCCVSVIKMNILPRINFLFAI